MFAKLFEEHSHIAAGSDEGEEEEEEQEVFFLPPFHLSAPESNDGMTWT